MIILNKSQYNNDNKHILSITVPVFLFMQTYIFTCDDIYTYNVRIFISIKIPMWHLLNL